MAWLLYDSIQKHRMPEGPSLLIAKEEMLPFRNKKVLAVAGNTKTNVVIQLGNGVFVIAEVFIYCAFGCLFGGFKLDIDEWNAVNKQHNIGTAFVHDAENRQLAHR